MRKTSLFNDCESPLVNIKVNQKGSN